LVAITKIDDKKIDKEVETRAGTLHTSLFGILTVSSMVEPIHVFINLQYTEI
jgi:hypothetical protein